MGIRPELLENPGKDSSCPESFAFSGVDLLAADAPAAVSPLADETGFDSVKSGLALPAKADTLSTVDTLSIFSDDTVVSHLQRQDPRKSFAIMEPSLKDALQLAKLYKVDYVGIHSCVHSDLDGVNQATFEEWEKALGPVDFNAVIADVAAAAGVQAKKVKSGKNAKTGGGRGGKGRQEPVVGIFKCTEKQAPSGKQSPVVGYILFELREKGSSTKRQQYCEIVNIVVSSHHRGLGAGRLLYEHLLRHLQECHPTHAKDMRLYVAERNDAPRAWYSRLGFRESGWQSEQVQGTEVKFVRMIKDANSSSSS
jgi:ribosomal protein S18 acetylase RimI-like enzyme